MAIGFWVRPSADTNSPGTLYIGDVGWNTYEEINIARSGDGGGRNFGWPCREGPGDAPEYPDLDPASSGCDTIMTPPNPGPLTEPAAYWHHTDPKASFPVGPIGINAIGGIFYTGESYPMAYRGAYFYADYFYAWINVLKLNSNDEVINTFGFATDGNSIVDIAADPVSGDLFYVSVFQEVVYRISYDGPGTGDVNGDFSVDVSDLLAVINTWGPCPGGPSMCPADINGNGQVNVEDLLLVINNWG